jgi:hypothetical protein
MTPDGTNAGSGIGFVWGIYKNNILLDRNSTGLSYGSGGTNGQWQVSYNGVVFTVTDLGVAATPGTDYEVRGSTGGGWVSATFEVTGGGGAGNELPQCATRTFSDDDAPIPPITGALWEVRRNGMVIDQGDRHDRFGLNGWGVVAPGLGGAGTLTVTAPCPLRAPVGTGYVALSGGHSVSFEVTEGTCPGSPSIGPKAPPMFLFSTGILSAYRRLTAPTLSRVVVGAPAASASPLANLTDASSATTADLPQTDADNYRYLVCDLGSAQEIGAVRLRNVTVPGGIVRVYAKLTAAPAGDFSGATELLGVPAAPVAPLAGAGLQFEPAAGAASPVTARYVYIVPSGSAVGATIGGLEIVGRKTPFAELQQVGISPMFEEATLRGPTWVNQYPVANAFHSGSIEFSAQFARFYERALETLTGADVTGEGGAEVTLTIGQTATPPCFTLDLEGRTTEESGAKEVRFVAYECYAPGFSWSFNTNAFTLGDFKAAVYLSDMTGPAARLRVQQ